MSWKIQNSIITSQRDEQWALTRFGSTQPVLDLSRTYFHIYFRSTSQLSGCHLPVSLVASQLNGSAEAKRSRPSGHKVCYWAVMVDSSLATQTTSRGWEPPAVIMRASEVVHRVLS